jgi:hypothetical protein
MRSLLECVPPFDLLEAAGRNSKSAAAAAAATAAADAATTATAATASASASSSAAVATATTATATATAVSSNADGNASNGNTDGNGSAKLVASLEASMAALDSCRDATRRSLQLDAIATGLNVDITVRLKSAYSTHLKAGGLRGLCSPRQSPQYTPSFKLSRPDTSGLSPRNRGSIYARITTRSDCRRVGQWDSRNG